MLILSLGRAAVSIAGLALIPQSRNGLAVLQMSHAASAEGALNILGTPLEVCSKPKGPITGWRRDGYCNTDDSDFGSHCVCCELTQDFLEYTKSKGNDLSTPRGGFPGLKPGDRWCLCSSRWLQAQQAGKAPLVIPKSTHARATDVVPLEVLMKHRSDVESPPPPAAAAEHAAAAAHEEL